MIRSLALCAAITILACLAARAEEHEGPPPEEIRHLLERADRGEPLDPHALAVIDRFVKDYLFRVPCNVLEDSRFSLAQLQARTGRGEQAIATLRKLAAETKDDDVRSAAMYNIGRVHQAVLKDPANAADVYAEVTGRFEAMARRSLLLMYLDAGEGDKAVAFLKEQAAKATGQGAKLALLRQLGNVAARAGDNDAAIAAYQQISDEFTPEDIQAIRDAAARRARTALEEAMELREADRWHEAEQTLQGLRNWAGQLLAADRMDEFHAVREEHERHERQMDEMHHRFEEEFPEPEENEEMEEWEEEWGE